MAGRLVLLSAEVSLSRQLARHLLAEHRALLPDLSYLTLLVPHGAALRGLRSALAQEAGRALLSPQILTLSAWARLHPQAAPALPPLQARLRLAESLQAHLHLFPGQDALGLAEELQELFSELSLQAPELGADAERFVQRIERGYGARHARLSQEARLVHLLWQAWLSDHAGQDPTAAYLRDLAAAFAAQAPENLVLTGFDSFSPAELPLVRYALSRGAALWVQGRREGRDGASLHRLLSTLGVEPEISPAPVSPRSQTLQALFSPQAPLRVLREARDLADLHVQTCRDPEEEARVAELAIREWLLAGKRDIVVLSSDRRYARRLRALLERAGVPLNDQAGWALSTSRAAASLVHWLDARDREFGFRPVLDLLKSPFYTGDEEQGLVAELETAIYAAGLTGGLKALGEAHPPARKLLRPLEDAARALTLAAGAHPARDWCAALLRALRVLPLWARWAEDPAGRELLRVLGELEQGLSGSALRLDWAEFRRLLDRLLEQASFSPQAARGPVRLLTLDQSPLLDCEALLISGAAAGHFPAPPPAQAFFNQAVRAELGLSTHAQRQDLALARFTRLLQAVPEVLITYAAEEEGSEARPAAWVAWLHSAGVGDAAALAARAGRAGVEVAVPAPALSPQPAPQVVLPAAGLPAALSASEHQSLINCPYQFYVRKLLGLRAPQEPDEPEDRSDYGNLAHRVLRAFHEPVEGLPPPFKGPLTAERRAEAGEHLRRLAQAVFAQPIAARVLAQAWLAEFESLVPELLDWMLARSAQWPHVQVEHKLAQALTPQLTVHGRADRLESDAAGRASVVDYKTGAAPKRDQVQAGEDVQVVHYGLAAPAVEAVEYLQLRREESKSVALTGEDFSDLRSAVRVRLLEVFAQMGSGVPLPANGDEASCAHCEAVGLCRKGAWADG